MNGAVRYWRVTSRPSRSSWSTWASARVGRLVSYPASIAAAEKLKTFDKPILLAWGADDKLFPPAHARRFASEVPGARLELIENSRTFVMLDQPDRLSELVSEVASLPARA